MGQFTYCLKVLSWKLVLIMVLERVSIVGGHPVDVVPQKLHTSYGHAWAWGGGVSVNIKWELRVIYITCT